MTLNPFVAELAQFDDEWGELEDSPFFDRLPDGRYQVRVLETAIERAKRSGRLQLKWEFAVLNGPHKNRRIWLYHGLDNADALPYLKRDLAVAGLELTRLSELAERLHELNDVVLEVTLKTKGEYQNVYINKLIDAPFPPDEPVFDHDDRPF